MKNVVSLCLALLGLVTGMFQILAEKALFETHSHITWAVEVEANRTYRLSYSTTFREWGSVGDPVLLSSTEPFVLPEGPAGFLKLIPADDISDLEPRIVLLGDSTMADLSALSIQYHGWGQHLKSFFDPRVTLVNLAEAGMGTEEYFNRQKGRILETISPDFVILQFGHIELKNEVADEIFTENLSKIIDEIRAIGAVPILVTPVAIRLYDETGSHINELASKRGIVINLALEKNVFFVDLNRSSSDVYARMGPVSSAFITVCGNDCDDISHFSRTGSHLVAALLTAGLPNLLKSYLVPLSDLVPDMLNAFETDRRFSSLSTPFVELTGFRDEQVWDWLFPDRLEP